MLSPSAPLDRPRHIHDWERIDLDVRLRIIELLRDTPQPWRFLLEQILEEFPVKRQHVHSLIMTVVMYGPSDPFILGQKSLDNPDHVDEQRQQAEEVRAAVRREQKQRWRNVKKANKARAAAEAAAQLVKSVEPRVRKRAAKAS